MIAGDGLLTVGFALAIGLLLLFSIALVRVLQAGHSVPCHCIGVRAVPIGVEDLWRNGVFISSAALGLLTDSRAPTNGVLVTNVPALIGMLGAASAFGFICTHLRELARAVGELQLFVAGTHD
jgi:hypothetical protein